MPLVGHHEAAGGQEKIVIGGCKNGRLEIGGSGRLADLPSSWNAEGRAVPASGLGPLSLR
ncbi:hypothetical protein [Rhodopila globiformis]|uniref:hypothetical protein n=1 Tax=Rhodopila globiformis TaxID=1071 RepID=UPI0011B0B29A|nr:hypothetical protein [Rhodopila globiformis]